LPEVLEHPNARQDGITVTKRRKDEKRDHPSSPAEHKIHIVEKLQSATVTSKNGLWTQKV